MSRRIRWNDDEFVHVRPDGDEACFEDCVELRDQWGDEVIRTFTLPFSTWVWLAESILSTRDRRKAEAAKQPKRWYVEAKWIEGVSDVQVKESSYQGDDWDRKVARGYDDGSVSFYIMAKDENEAYHKAKDAAHSLGVWNREYLA
jgi:hypothetical protein